MDNPSFERDNQAKSSVNPSKINIIKLKDEPATRKIEPKLSPKEEKKMLKAEKKRLKKQKEEEEMERTWVSYSKPEKIRYVLFSILKGVIFIVLLYLFLLSLNFMTIGFTLVSPYALKAGDAIRFLLKNPFAALAIGIIATAILQNATATTSIAVTMVGAGIIPSVKSAIPIIMGSNIGTCVTNSFIALTLSGDPNEFKRAFSAATLNDMFNYLTTAVLITIEIIFDFLNIITEKLADLMPKNTDDLKNANFIGAILNPLCDLFIKLDNDQIDAINNGSNTTEIALRCCEKPVFKEQINNTDLYKNFSNLIGSDFQNNKTLSLIYYTNLTQYQNYFFQNGILYLNRTGCNECGYWCMPMLRAFGDGGTGLFWIILSLIVLLACLFGIVKVLSLLIVGPIAHGVRKAINASFPGKMKWFTQVVLFIVSFLLTLIVQSSNIITATLVPLCGIGIVTLQRVYVMTLGSNVGTTLTGILSAFTQPPSALKKSLQLAFVYTFFNSFGVLFWLPIPFLRFPKVLAKKLGNIIFEYKWFLYVYVSMAYFIIPLIILGLALIPYWIGLAIFGIPIILLILGYLIVLILRKFFPRILPEKLKSFDWLPEWMRSLAYWDRKVKNFNFCPCRKKKNNTTPSAVKNQETNIGEDDDSNFIPNMIRRFSAIDSVVKEARVYSRRNTIVSNPESSDDEHHSKSKGPHSKKNSIFRIEEDGTVRF